MDASRRQSLLNTAAASFSEGPIATEMLVPIGRLSGRCHRRQHNRSIFLDLLLFLHEADAPPRRGRHNQQEVPASGMGKQHCSFDNSWLLATDERNRVSQIELLGVLEEVYRRDVAPHPLIVGISRGGGGVGEGSQSIAHAHTHLARPHLLPRKPPPLPGAELRGTLHPPPLPVPVIPSSGLARGKVLHLEASPVPTTTARDTWEMFRGPRPSSCR